MKSGIKITNMRGIRGIKKHSISKILPIGLKFKKPKNADNLKKVFY